MTFLRLFFFCLSLCLFGCDSILYSDYGDNDFAIASYISQGSNNSTYSGAVQKKSTASMVPISPNSQTLSQAYNNNGLNLFNRYLVDIEYNLYKTNKSFVAIGTKFTVPNREHKPMIYTKDSSNTIGGLMGIDSKNRIKVKAKGMSLEETSFSNLSNWNDDNFDDALESFFQSCKMFTTKAKRNKPIASNQIGIGTAEQWSVLCQKAIQYARNDKSKEFFEENFMPFIVINNDTNSNTGEFTGYYEYGIKGSFHKTDKYRFPIYKMPPECKNGNACPTRKEISNGALRGRNLEICWTDDPINLWQMQLQGSGIVELVDGNYVRVRFGGSNNQPYKRIWDYFNPDKEMPPPPKGHKYSTVEIKNWLRDRPDKAVEVLNYNPVYIFFEPNNSKFAVGSTGYPLTPSRSVAIDTEYIPYGLPLWLETKIPVKNVDQHDTWLSFNRLVVAQDTGSAIKGPIRADIFYGFGDKAVYLANNTKFDGRYFMLIPVSMLQDISILKK